MVYVDGEFTPALTDKRLSVISPATGAIIGTVPACGVADVDRAVTSARTAFDLGVWSSLTGTQRADAIDRIADNLSARAESISALITAEGGFASQFVASTHVDGALKFLRYYASLARQDSFEDIRPSPAIGAQAVVRRQPIGVVAALVPWNIPLLGALSKIAPALAAGCTVVYKPSPENPLLAYLVAEAVDKAELPRGVFNVIPADTEGSRHLVSHPDVDMVAFTGSTAVGRSIATTCAGDFRRYALELGGNAAAIVLEDAPAELIAKGLTATGLVMNSGQACIAQRRVLVPASRYDEVVSILAAAANALPIGDPTDPSTVIGPLITAEHRDRVLEYIKGAEAEGAVIAAGGNIPDTRDQGFYIQPTILADVTNDMRVAKEEVFGPVICVIKYSTVEEAINIARDTEYGLSSSVWTTDIARAEEIARQLRVGSVYVNGMIALDPTIPFGGFGHSGVGRELGPEGLAEYYQTQSIFLPAHQPA
ncbi:aldehyde dehydrogenase [Rhodococcus sp. OK302]|uniref:aldehyde dehydrogenase n=1 Tax=Rhodococcus sp. OK302 TaxID=1882769 RepID=UPI000B943949|nr:aldehyde dehydrogenase [Rhodococcus sp. OK302]